MTLEKEVIDNVQQETMIKENTQTCPSFSIPKYILNLLLPKCAMVYGEVIPTVYLQIAVNINHKKNAKSWQEKKCWMGTKTIAKITKYNFRTVHNALQVLEDLDLIEKSYHGKLKMFQLKNNNLVEPQEIFNFTKLVEKKLLSNASEDKKEKIFKQFKQLNSKYYVFSSLNIQRFSKKVWFPNINILRHQLTLAESIYKGSSLFFINVISQTLFKKQYSKTNNKDISEADRSLLLGCSQPTLNRYITAYENANILKREKSKSQPITLIFNESILNSINDKNSIERVVGKVEETQFICSVCEKEFKSKRSLSMHISKSKDSEHVAFKESKKVNRNIEEKNTKEEKSDKYMSIPCDCTMTCKSCFKNWKTDYFDGCNHPRKEAFIEEYKINQEEPNNKEVEFKKIPSVKKGPSPDTAPGLVKYFYNITGGASPNWSKESRQVKNLLTNKMRPLSPDEVRIVLSHMARKGHIDLRFLSNSVNDALLEQKYLKDMETEGTAAYLVKKFYNGHGLKVNIQTLIKDVQRVQETLNSGLSYEDTDTVIEYMISIKCTILNFIGSKRNEALINKQQRTLVKTASKNTNNALKNNPSFFDQDDLIILRDELLGGRLHIKKVSQEQKPAVIDIAKKIFKENKYNQRFTAFEWAWRVGLELDEEMYNIAIKDINKETSLKYALNNSSRLSEDKLNILRQLNIKFENWLQKQRDMFEKNIQNS